MISSAEPAPIVLVVAYNSDDHLAACLAGVGGLSDVVVIDNGASAVARAVAETSGFRYIATPGNVGFAAAVNIGLDSAWDGTRDVLLLNPDARVTPADVRALQEALHEPGAHRAAVGPRLVGDNGTPQRASWPIPSPIQVWLDALGLLRLWHGRCFVVGAVLLLNGAALGEVGRLDERYFLYAEETDWQLRAQRAGWTVTVVDGVVAQHAGAASSSDAGQRNVLFHASGEAFARRWYGRIGWLVMRLGSLVASGRRSLAGPRERRRLSRQTFALYLRGPIRAQSADRPAA